MKTTIYTGTKTEKNLRSAFIGESETRNKYLNFASIAQKEGYENIAAKFVEIAENEKIHANVWFKEYYKTGTTNENLQDSIDCENYEWNNMYEEFAKEAEREGFSALAFKFRMVGLIEKNHEKLFKELLDQMNQKNHLEKKSGNFYRCRYCGYVLPENNQTPPVICPVCNIAKSFAK